MVKPVRHKCSDFHRGRKGYGILPPLSHVQVHGGLSMAAIEE